MSDKKLIILGIITACMIAWAVVQAHISSNPGVKQKVHTYLIQGLDPSGIDSITLGTGTEMVTLKRNGNQFVVVNKDNYPAVISEINDLITSCLDIKTVELYTDNPANHKDLGVTEEDAELVVKFLKPDSDLLAGVVVGKSKEQGRGNFVRLLPGDKVYVTQESPWIKNQAMNYVDKELISVDRKDIESVTVSSPNQTYTLKIKEDSEELLLENIPEGKKLKDNESENVFTALSNLRFNDVKKKSPDNDLAFDREFICKAKDSTLYTVKIAKSDEKTYITCQVEFTDQTPVTKEDEVESEEELKKKEAKLLARDKAEESSARHKGWIYEISEYNANNITKEISELLEEEQVEKETKTP